ncbi:Glutamate receptor-like 35, partial [Homarus americanus]
MFLFIHFYYTLMFVIRAPVDGVWGARTRNNTWTGMVGELWRGEADFSLRLFWSAARKEAIDFTRAYIFEPFVMITRKPGPLPQHLAPIKPFTGDIWIALVVTTTLAGAILWGAQRAWSRFSGGRGLDAVSAFLYILGMLLAEPTDALPTNITAQMLVGSWWVFCVVVVAMYRGSLIAHLTAPVNPSPIDTLDQLLEVEGATWGLEGGHGVGWDWFKYNTNPKVQHMFTTMQVTPREEQLARVLGGQHAFFTWKYYIKMVVALHHTDIYGHTPLHISKQEFISGQSGWGENAPFLKPLDRIIGRLVETGLIDHWLEELFGGFLARIRRPDGLKEAATKTCTLCPDQPWFSHPHAGRHAFTFSTAGNDTECTLCHMMNL